MQWSREGTAGGWKGRGTARLSRARTQASSHHLGNDQESSVHYCGACCEVVPDDCGPAVTIAAGGRLRPIGALLRNALPKAQPLLRALAELLYSDAGRPVSSS